LSGILRETTGRTSRRGARRWIVVLTSALLATSCGAPAPDKVEFRALPVAEYRDRMAAGWLGQMIGVSWGAPTEFQFLNRIFPESAVPKFRTSLVNGSFDQDDLYVEMTFLATLDEHGLNVSPRQAGIDFANSTYPLWHANEAGRENLRAGIAPPDSGHPDFTAHSDDIDYQIESDFAGLISPGLPDEARLLGETFGRLVTYGDGLYGGQFMSCMYTEAFFDSDPARLVDAGLACIPDESQYSEAIRDVVAWWRENPDDWEVTWALAGEKYHENREFRKASCTALPDQLNIDAKLNGAYVVLGLLYGEGDPRRTMEIAMRSGQDSDCNPSSAGGVLLTALGLDAVPEGMAAALDEEATWIGSDYTFGDLLAVSERLAREQVHAAGGWVETDPSGEEVFMIPVQDVTPTPLEQSWDPLPSVGSRYTERSRDRRGWAVRSTP